LWDTYNEDKSPRADVGKIARIAVIAALGVIIFAIISNQSVNLFMNVTEFGNVFNKPLYYLTLSGLVLAAISLVRVNFATRHSVTWYGIRMIITFLKRGEYESKHKALRYSEFQMSKLSFSLWQLTKVVLFAPLFGNIMFGMGLDYAVLQGHDIGLGSVGAIFSAPFVNLPTDGSYAQGNIVQMFPMLTLIVPALLAAVGLRILLYIGASGTIHVISQYMMDTRESKPKFLSYISTIEIILGATIFWIGFTMFFNHMVDFNTRYAIIGTLVLGVAFIGYGFFDRGRAKVIIYPTRRHVYSRLLTVGAIIIIVGAVMAINNSIADSKDWRAPYVAQEIAVNRYMHELDQVQVVNYDIKQPSATPSDIQKIVSDNSNVLSNVRLLDSEEARKELAPELGHRTDISFVDIDVTRLGDGMYWAGSTAPKLPENMPQSNPWYAQHILYTHSNAGVKMIQASDGSAVDGSKFFPQQNVYYGESDDNGIFSRYWSAYPIDRTKSDELDQFFYNGTGGIDLSPPMSWMFEPTFMLSDPATAIHIMRYKDVNSRMDLLYPYFVYQFGFGGTPTNPNFKDVDVYPVTDGKNTYWLMPLIALLDTSSVPWSSNTPSSFMLKLTGYALIDAYNGSVQVIVTGDDFFSDMFYEQYKDVGATREIPQWLSGQIKYPEEMVMWKVSKFNAYHITDPKEYIDGKMFYEAPQDPVKKEVAPPYYVFAKPQGSENPKFVAIQPLQPALPKDAASKNLVGYMVVENDIEGLGKMTFYSLPSDQTKFLSPADAKSTLEKNKEYMDIKNTYTKSDPVSSDSLLYKVGDYEVYFSALFAGSESRQIATVAAVGANPVASTYQVGLGDTPKQAFENYLQKLAGIAPPEGQPQAGNQTTPDTVSRIERLEKVFSDVGLVTFRPTSISAPVSFAESSAAYRSDSDIAQAESAIHTFIEKFASHGGRVFEWRDGTKINFGTLQNVNGIVENHYISIEVGQ
jgi:uncharacterized membrane protein (UPF0182 family)